MKLHKNTDFTLQNIRDVFYKSIEIELSARLSLTFKKTDFSFLSLIPASMDKSYIVIG